MLSVSLGGDSMNWFPIQSLVAYPQHVCISWSISGPAGSWYKRLCSVSRHGMTWHMTQDAISVLHLLTCRPHRTGGHANPGKSTYTRISQHTQVARRPN